MANGNDRDIEFLAQQLEDLEEKAALLEQQKEEAEALLERARNDAAADEKARQELLDETSQAYSELEAQLKDYVARYNEVSRKLEAAQNAEDFHYNAQTYRTQRKLNEHYQKEIKTAKAEMRQLRATNETEREAATRELNAAREELYQSKQDCNNAIQQLDIYTRVFNDIIFARFAAHYTALTNEDANSINPVKLEQAVACAKRRDAEYETALKKYYKAQKSGKQIAEPQRDPASYTSIVEGIVEEYLSLRETYEKTSIGKQKLDEFDQKLTRTLRKKESIQTPELVIAKILNDQSKTYVGSVATRTRRGKTVVATIVSTFLALGVLAGSIFGIYKATHKNLVDTQNTLDNTTTQVQVLDDELTKMADGIIDQNVFGETLKTINENVGSTESIRVMFGTEEAIEAQEAKTGREVSTTGIDAAVQKAQEAQEKAETLYEQKDEVISGYKNALKTQDVEQINTEAAKVNKLSNDLNECKTTTAEAVSDALKAADLHVQDFKEISDLIKNPYSSVQFGADAATKYKDYLANRNDGRLVGIVSNEYVKSTGDVTILAECKDGERNTFYNLFQYKIAPNIHVLGEEQMLAPILNGETVTKLSFNKDLVTSVEGETTQMATDKGAVKGETSIKYGLTETENKAGEKVTTMTALVTVTDADGKMSVKVVKESLPHDKNVDTSIVEAQLKKKIVEKVNAVLDREVTLEVEDENVSEP